MGNHKNILSFYGTIGNPEETFLTIDRTGFLDLSYLFKNFFSHMGDGFTRCWSERWEINENQAVVKFNLEKEFFKNLLGRYEPKEFASFLKEHMTDMFDYHNDILIKRLEDFDKNFERIYIYMDKKHFFLRPNENNKDSLAKKVKEIESIKTPNRSKRITNREIEHYVSRRDALKSKYSFGEGERGVTKLYRNDSLNELLDKLEENFGKPFFPVNPYMSGPHLDYFSIIRSCYEIPVEHLKIVEK